MSTGPIESWNTDPNHVGPIYPFAGWEGLMFAACVAFCVAFFVWKFSTENAKYAAQAKGLRESDDLERALADNDETSQ